MIFFPSQMLYIFASEKKKKKTFLDKVKWFSVLNGPLKYRKILVKKIKDFWQKKKKKNHNNKRKK